jgi:hypothetical protein
MTHQNSNGRPAWLKVFDVVVVIVAILFLAALAFAWWIGPMP